MVDAFISWMEDWIVLHWLELENGITQYGISALCYTSMYSQKMLGTVWYFNNSITNKKDIFAERKTKTSGLWILDTGLILKGICIGISDEIRSEAVNLYLLLNKIWRWSKIYYVKLSFVVQYRWMYEKLISAVIKLREKHSGLWLV